MVLVSRRYSLPTAILASSVMFALAHSLNKGLSLLAFFNLVLYGIFAALYFIRRGSIWGVAAFHSTWNFVQGNFFGIQVSGLKVGSSVLTSELTETGRLVNGGGFGLEGGLAVTLVLAIGIAVLYFMKPKKEDGVIPRPSEPLSPKTPPENNPPEYLPPSNTPPEYTPPSDKPPDYTPPSYTSPSE
ncbi:MAG TPA: CPBP family intramembrane metalloprotease [Clostridiales bacterium]|jgi:hypothetical protein|nr:CPBP family intramembrane metalloprotease [Clostridiales bacterium]